MDFPMGRDSTKYLKKLSETEKRDMQILDNIFKQIQKLRQLDVDVYELTRSQKHIDILGARAENYIQHSFQEQDKIAKILLKEIHELLANYNLQAKMLIHLSEDRKKNEIYYRAGKRSVGSPYQPPSMWIKEK